MQNWILTHLGGHGLSSRMDFFVMFTALFGGMAINVCRLVKGRARA